MDKETRAKERKRKEVEKGGKKRGKIGKDNLDILQLQSNR
jgi:hypothetical protein